MAAFDRRLFAVRFLLAMGADAKARCPGGQTALHAISWQGAYDCDSDRATCERIIRALVAAGAVVDAVDDYGQTPLHDAASGDWGNPTAVRVLLELGADPNASSQDGITPLMCAAEMGELECVELLCNAGADPTRTSLEGQTAMDLARQYPTSGREAVIQRLEEAVKAWQSRGGSRRSP